MRPLSRSLKAGHNPAHKISELTQRFEDRPTLENIRLPERYVKGEFNILVRLSIPSYGGDWIAMFESKEPLRHSTDVEPDLFRRKHVTSKSNNAPKFAIHESSVHVKSNPSYTDNGGCQKPVLIGKVRLVESPA
jgi:hypothetical protein